MVGIVLVSHSRALAEAVQQLVRSMTGPDLPLAIAAGVGDSRSELGTDAIEISEAIVSVQGPEGVLVLMDMGSAILSSETALDIMDEDARANVCFCSAPFVEGAIAAGVTAHLGGDLKAVEKEALASLKAKQAALRPAEEVAPASATPQAGSGSSSAQPVSATLPSSMQTLRLVVPNAHGLHARPAARLILEAKPFQAEITVRNLTNQRGPASLRSLSSLAGLEVLHDHEIELAATGPDAAAALQAIDKLAQAGFGENIAAKSAPGFGRNAAQKTLAAHQPLPVCDGLAIGPGFFLQPAAFEIPQDAVTEPAVELERLRGAIAAVQAALESRQQSMSNVVGREEAEIYRAQSVVLQDAAWMEQARHLITARQRSAAIAWNEAMQEMISRYASLNDPYLRERAADVRDVGGQVLEQLGARRAEAALPKQPSILIAEDLSPQQVSQLDRGVVAGVILLDGGPTAHSSILLKALGIPTVVQARSALSEVPFDSSETIALDGSSGQIWLQPSPGELEQLRSRRAEQETHAVRQQQASRENGSTLDGHRVHVFANIGSVSEAAAAVQSGAEGIGLLRTEFLFLNRTAAPTEDEQIAALREISAAFGERPVIIRTLDIGGDKTVPYLNLPKEENPFLGVRALRLCLAQNELFATQLRAILRAGLGKPFRIMFPMIADTGDLKLARDFLEQVHRDLEKKNVPHLWPVETGIMIEIPSAALQAEALARHADFFSIGTNDLTQYALAADRGNPALGCYQDATHPAVLRLIEHVVQGARRHGRLVGVCGEAASNEFAAALFVGLGVEELSLSATGIPRLKAMLRERKLADLQQLAQRALECATAGEVRALAAARFASGAAA